MTSVVYSIHITIVVAMTCISSVTNAFCDKRIRKVGVENSVQNECRRSGPVEVAEEHKSSESNISTILHTSVSKDNNQDILCTLTGECLDVDDPVCYFKDCGTQFNFISYAVKKGFQAQNELCSSYCNGSRKIFLQKTICVDVTISCSKCYCDKACVHYRDCCPSLGNEKVAPDIAPVDRHGCVEIMRDFKFGHVKIIRNCPSGSRAREFDSRPVQSNGTRLREDCSLCRHGLSLALSLDSNGVYCNTNCGRCNGETNLINLPQTACIDTGETVHVWSYKDDKKQRMIPARTCFRYELSQPHPIDTCTDELISNHALNIEMAALCQLYSYPLNVRRVSYRNLFCALCNGEMLRRQECVHLHTKPIVLGGSLNTLTSVKPLYVYETVGPMQCSDDQWYDFVLDKCRTATCHNARTRVPDHLYCEDPSIANSSLLFYTLSISFTVVTGVTYVPCLCDWNPVREAIISHLTKTIQKLNLTTYTMKVSTYNKHIFGGVFDAFVEFIARKSKNQTEFDLKIISSFTHDSLGLEILRNRVIDVRTNIAPNVGYVKGAHFLVSFPNGSCCFGADRYFLLDSCFRNIPSSITRKKLLFNSLVPYAHVVLSGSEYKYDANHDTVILTYANASLPIWQTENISQELHVAIVYLQQAYKSARLSPKSPRHVRVGRRADLVVQILSLCCLVVSIASLIFLLATYCTFSQLRSLPGLNNMCLAAWLMLAQLLLLVVPDLTELSVCHVLGMALHYAWLSVISWCCVCSVHMFHVFVTQLDQMRTSHSQSWYLIRYVCLAQMIPAVIVGLVVGCNMVLTEGRETGYGGHVCYLNTVVLRGVALLLPLALTMTLNIALLVVTGCALSEAQRVQNLGRQTEPSYIRIYAKLSSLTGLCWSFAIIAELPGCGWMLYVSAVLNGLQGFQLAVSYAGNKRVLKLWWDKMTGKGKQPHTRTSDVTGRSLGHHSSNTVCSNTCVTNTDQRADVGSFPSDPSVPDAPDSVSLSQPKTCSDQTESLRTKAK